MLYNPTGDRDNLPPVFSIGVFSSTFPHLFLIRFSPLFPSTLFHFSALVVKKAYILYDVDIPCKKTQNIVKIYKVDKNFLTYLDKFTIDSRAFLEFFSCNLKDDGVQ